MRSLNDKEIQFKKGTVIGWDWFFVVVEVTYDGQLNCICDNANNIYSYSINEVLTGTDPHEWVVIQPEETSMFENYDLPEGFREEFKHLVERGLPYEVMVEVMSGQHDKRFKHWR